MVVLTVVRSSNPHTVNFGQPIPRPNYIRLLSCSLYNSWYNLKKDGEIVFFFDDDIKKDINLIIPKGHYSVERLAKELENSFKKYNFEMKKRTYTTFAQMVISNPSNKKIKINSYLADLLGLSQEINFLTLIKTLLQV